MKRALLWCTMSVALSGTGWGQTDATGSIQNLSELARLSAAEADRKIPAVVRGTVTFDFGNGGFTMEDGHAGCFVSAELPRFGTRRVGEPVEVQGVSGGGGFAPMIVASEIRTLGPLR